MPLKNGRTTAALQAIVVGSIIPPGTIQSFGGGTLPQGWLLCDGSTVSRSAYPELFSAIGTAHGSGDGSTTFHLPDLRGRFLRGADNMGTGAAGRDSDAAGRTAGNAGGNTGNNVGSVQSDAMQGHYHNNQINNNGAGAGSMPQAASGSNWVSGGANYVRNATSDGSNGTPRTSSETRPQNLAVEFMIKI